jgi:hypothetical protein
MCSYDILEDRAEDGMLFRMLNIIDDFTMNAWPPGRRVG